MTNPRHNLRDVYPATPTGRTAILVRNGMSGVRIGRTNIYAGFGLPTYVYPNATDVQID